jgi:uncharacterized protein (TIGR00299 family) protein
MKTLYFDLIGGISGDMTVAGLMDLGVSVDFLRRQLTGLKVSGYSLKCSLVQRGHIKAKKFDVVIKEPKNYSYQKIIRLVNASTLGAGVKKNILKVYETLAAAEKKVHGHKHQDIRFHQLGDIDSIVDIAGACICLDSLEAGDIYYSAIPMNKKMSAATAELIRDKRLYFTGLVYENVTPTGMAILTALGRQIDVSVCVVHSIKRSGYGAGSVDALEVSNCLRVCELEEPKNTLNKDEILVIESNIDDMNPQFFDFLFEKLIKAGALDVFVTSVVMKKTRPGFLLTVLSNRENLGKITELVLGQTTAIGVRFYPVNRLKCPRRTESIDFKGHRARVKLIELPQKTGLRVAPEYDDVRDIAIKTGQPIAAVFNGIKQKAELKWRSQG